MPALQPKLRDPFLLPVCDCGGPMNLASLEPHPTQAAHELKPSSVSRALHSKSSRSRSGRRRASDLNSFSHDAHTLHSHCVRGPAE